MIASGNELIAIGNTLIAFGNKLITFGNRFAPPGKCLIQFRSNVIAF